MAGVRALPIESEQADLVRAAAAGDAAAFDRLVEHHSERVFRLALRMLGNRQDAEDVQQETFIQAFRNLHKFRGDASFATWVYSIAARLCLDRQSRAAQRPDEEVTEPERLANHALDGPVARLSSTEAAAHVQQALAALARPDRLLIILKYVEGLSHEEIARVLGCSAESSHSRLARAKRIFREILERMD